MNLTEKAPKANPKAANEVPSFKKLTIRDQVKIVELLKDHCSTKNDYAVYAPGYSDETIAQMCESETATTNGVARIRKELYGDIRKYSPSPINNVQRLEKLEKIVAELCRQLGVDPTLFE